MKNLKTQIKKYKSRIILLIILGSLFYLDWFHFTPIIEKIYLNDDIQIFEKNSWKYSLITFSIICIFYIMHRLLKPKRYKNTWYTFSFFLILHSTILSYCLNPFIDSTILYLNTFYKKKTFKTKYLVQRHDSNKVFQLYNQNKDQIIYSEENLNKIDSLRNNQNLKSIYNLKNNDTIIINYQIGFLDTKYLKK